MARITFGALGDIQGKVGQIIVSSWKGKPYVKAYTKYRATKPGEKELANREKFGKAQAWLRPLLEFVREGFRGYSQYSQGFVAAKSYLLKNAIEGDLSTDEVLKNIRINPALVKLSFGTLPLPNNIAVRLAEPGKLEFTWDYSYGDDGDSNDQAMMLAYDPEKGQDHFITAGQFRKTGSDILYLPTRDMTGYTYHIYLAFNAVDRTNQSHSVYLGTITV